MIITRDILATKILAFLNLTISPKEIAEWAENAMLNAEYEEVYFDVISDALAKVGLVNVESFEIPISEFLTILQKLNYSIIFGLNPTDNRDKVKYA